ncbi:MAG TPA: TonB family protein [Verrucomicrobiae bacterium]|jgi:TonB family protein|nr:TonB family protein [Verrucomicrobiae bacterium]
MNNTDANRTSSRELKDELARLCLPGANRDPNRKLAWMNSICILFLLVGILGTTPASVPLKSAPPIEEIASVILEAAPPPQAVTVNENENQNDQPPPEAQNVVVVVPNAPNINFSVPTIGNLVAPSMLAQAPPLNPMQRIAPVTHLSQISNTGSSGSRPQPPYPKIALDAGQQGTVSLLITADSAGKVASIQIKGSSGSSILDRATEDFVRRHWTLPSGASTNQIFETSVTYQLQAD